VGAGVILLWSGGLSVLLFSLLWRFDILRLKPEVEEAVSRRNRMRREPQAKVVGAFRIS
jgi:hypothetical protein